MGPFGGGLDVAMQKVFVDRKRFDAGQIYEHTFDVLIERVCNLDGAASEDELNMDAELVCSATVNGALACELYMKSMLEERTRGHDLLELFRKLSLFEQTIIRGKTIINMMNFIEKNYGEKDFYADLKMMRNGYVDWRYYYEHESTRTSPMFYKAFMIALRETATIRALEDIKFHGMKEFGPKLKVVRLQ